MSNIKGHNFADEVEEARRGTCYCLALRQASRRLLRLYDRKLSEQGLTIGQFGMLGFISGTEEYTVQALADFLDMNQSALSRGLAPLEKQGFLVSKSDPDDGRKRILELTPLGAGRLNEASKSWKSAQQELSEKNKELDIDSLMQTIAQLGAV
ncbi:MAG: MarR family winged helix-turn-helix transcriptional regulator [Rhizobiaceae bacterium]